MQGITIVGRKGPDCICPKLPVELLLVCRAVHNEAYEVLYSQNRFLLRGHSASDLSYLGCVSTKALATMRSLVLRLNCWPCRNGHDDLFRWKKDPTCVDCQTPLSRADAAWTATDPAARQSLPEWESFCSRLSRSISAGRLRLTFICDVQDLVSGQLIVGPLLSLPTLAACTIRLGRRKDQYDLTALAQETSLRLTGSYAPPPSGFPFEALPNELRRRILEFTHFGSTIDYARPLLRIERGKLVLNNPIPVHRPICCFKCTDTFADCCCPTIHASYAPNCTCRVLPMELFLVSKGMYRDALEVFYSSVTFDFMQDHQETIAFLDRLPRRALSLIQGFRIIIPDEHFLSWQSDNHAEQFRKLVTFIGDHMNATKLRLVVDTLKICDTCLWVDDNEENRFVYDVYLDIANTLCSLRGLRGVEFAMGWASELAPWMCREILGDRYTGEVCEPEHRPGDPDWFGWAPKWHSNTTRLPNSNYKGGP